MRQRRCAADHPRGAFSEDARAVDGNGRAAREGTREIERAGIDGRRAGVGTRSGQSQRARAVLYDFAASAGTRDDTVRDRSRKRPGTDRQRARPQAHGAGRAAVQRRDGFIKSAQLEALELRADIAAGAVHRHSGGVNNLVGDAEVIHDAISIDLDIPGNLVRRSGLEHEERVGIHRREARVGVRTRTVHDECHIRSAANWRHQAGRGERDATRTRRRAADHAAEVDLPRMSAAGNRADSIGQTHRPGKLEVPRDDSRQRRGGRGEVAIHRHRVCQDDGHRLGAGRCAKRRAPGDGERPRAERRVVIGDQRADLQCSGAGVGVGVGQGEGGCTDLDQRERARPCVRKETGECRASRTAGGQGRRPDRLVIHGASTGQRADCVVETVQVERAGSVDCHRRADAEGRGRHACLQSAGVDRRRSRIDVHAV